MTKALHTHQENRRARRQRRAKERAATAAERTPDERAKHSTLCRRACEKQLIRVQDVCVHGTIAL